MAVQSAVLGRLLAVPTKSSLQVRVKPSMVGTAALASGSKPAAAKRARLFFTLKPMLKVNEKLASEVKLLQRRRGEVSRLKKGKRDVKE